jgi:RimJ/RimL family protein N-acetyltransferase
MSANGQEVLALRDGSRVPVREVEPGDAPALRRFVERLSERSIHMRYFGPMKELSESQARHFAEVDGKDRFALVALDPEAEKEIVGVVRYEREGDTDRAEYAAVVEDRMQGKGLGIGLTRCLIEAARNQGVERLYALVMPENSEMLGMLHSLELPEHVKWEDGVEHVYIDIHPQAA